MLRSYQGDTDEREISAVNREFYVGHPSGAASDSPRLLAQDSTQLPYEAYEQIKAATTFATRC